MACCAFRLLVVAVTVPIVAGLTGCNGTYSTFVDNRTNLTVEARLVHDALGNSGPGEAIDTAIIGPGGVANLGPIEVPVTDPVRLEVSEARDEFALPERKTLPRGRTSVLIEPDRGLGGGGFGDGDESPVGRGFGPFRLRLLEGPELIGPR
ncbi:MAG: hypothetical protein AAF747_02455 [Planctomycetota bacterium]